MSLRSFSTRIPATPRSRLDDFAVAETEAKALAAIARAVELLAVQQSAHVVHRDPIAGLPRHPGPVSASRSAGRSSGHPPFLALAVRVAPRAARIIRPRPLLPFVAHAVLRPTRLPSFTGDGIGPEVTAAAARVVEAAGS